MVIGFSANKALSYLPSLSNGCFPFNWLHKISLHWPLTMAIFWVYSSHSLSLGKKVCRRNLVGYLSRVWGVRLTPVKNIVCFIFQIIMTNQKVFFRTLEFVLLVVWFVGAISGFHLEDECIYNKNMRTTQDNCKYGWEIDACGNKVSKISIFQ